MFIAAKNKHPGKDGERSFTLVETIFALGLLVTVILEVSNVQGRSLVLGEYNRKVTQASWLAKAVMALTIVALPGSETIFFMKALAIFTRSAGYRRR